MKTTALRVLEIMNELSEMFPECDRIHLNVGCKEISFHQCTHETATEVLRSFGANTRTKSVIQPDQGDDNGFYTMKGTVGGVDAVAFIHGIPPNCKKVVTVKQVPEMIPTGAMKEISVVEIVCGGGH